MALYKRGRVWWMRLTHKKKRIRKSTGATDRKTAEKIYYKLMTEMAEGKWLDRLPGEKKTFREMMERYMMEHSTPKKASVDRDRGNLTHLNPFFGSYLVTDINPRLINEYKAHRRIEKASPCTINRELAMMKHAFNLALREWEWVRDNPVLKVSMEKEPPPRDRWLAYEDEERVLSVAPGWIKPLIIFAVETGCRRTEMLTLQWRDVDFFGKVVRIFGSKTGERRTIPLTERALEVLKELHRTRVRALHGDWVFTYPPGQRVENSTLRKNFDRVMSDAAIDGFRWHDLRHTFASRLAQAGVDPYTIQRLMGHKSFVTTQRYAHHYVESLRKGIGSLEASRHERLKEVSAANSQLAQLGHNSGK